MSADRVADLDDPQLRVFAPLIYVAWSDFDLDPDDRAATLKAMAAQPWLRPAARAVIEAWLDPEHPPRADELARLRAIIDHVAETSSERARASFARVARAAATDGQARQAADDLSRDLGLIEADDDVTAPIELHADLAPPGGQTTDAITSMLGDVARAREAVATIVGDFLDGDHVDVRTRARQFLSTPHRVYGLRTDEHRDIVRGWLEDLCASGLPRLAFPGVTSTDDLAGFSALFEELAHGDLSLLVKTGVQFGLYGGAIWALGTERHRARLARVASGDELGCFAMSEVGHGSNVAGVETIARYDHATREIEIHTPGESARKEWIGGAAHDARFAVVFAQLEVAGTRHGVHAVLLPIRTDDGEPIAGVRTGDSGTKMGLNGVDNGRLWFEHVRVPVDNLLDRFATIDRDGAYASPIASPDKRFFTMLGTLIGGRISVGAGAVSASRAALAIAVRYAETRRQFGADVERRLMDYPTHRRRLLPHVADTVLLKVAFRQLRARHAKAFAGELGDTRELEAQAAALKVLGSRHAIAAVQAAREACGGQGYLAVNRIPELRTDVDIFTTFEGDNTVLAQLVGKAMLGAYRKQLATGGTRAVVRAVARRVGSALGVRRASNGSPRERSWQVAALAFREEHVVETCAARIKKRLDDHMEGEAAVLAVQDHVVAIAEAFGERCIADWFALEEAALKSDNATAKQLVKMCGDLALLTRIDAHAAWYLETGYYDTTRSREIKREITALIEQLAPHARTIVDAFRIPDACLAAPIAFFDPAHPTYP
ncbi:MAG: acyl-CoA dehydrogenase family protein [Kofleriaceae bacterium]